MDEKENLNNTNQQSNLNNNASPFDQNTEENPYNNPYFQYNDISSTPYYNSNGSDVTLNNDIYNQSYMNMNMNNSATDQNTVTSTTSDVANAPTNNIADNAVDLFNMSTEPENNATEEHEGSSSSEHINPILSQSLNNATEPVPNVDTNNQVQQINNNQLSGMPNEELQTPQNASTPIMDNSQNGVSVNNIQFGGTTNNKNAGSNYQQSNTSAGFVNDQFNNPQVESNNLQYNNPSSEFNTPFANSTQAETTNQVFENPQLTGNSQTIEGTTTINNTNVNNYQNSQNNTFGSENNEEFKKAWMDTLYEKAQKRKFSIPAFFFGGLYYLFRKVYLFGFIFVIITCVLPIIGLAITASTANFIFTFIFSMLSILFGVAYGFAFYPIYNKNVNTQLNKLKNTIKNPTQLIDTAKQKGGKSIIFLLLGILVSGLITSIAFITLSASIISSFFPQPDDSENSDVVAEEPTDINDSVDTFNFYNDYTLEYDSSIWQENTNGVLVSDSYSLAYIQSLEGLSQYGYDINTTEGRNGFHTYLYNLFSSSINSSTTTLELGESTFVYEQGIYYSYLDLVYATSIERCYFVLIPETDTFIEFILSNTDTIISDDVHNQVLTSFTTITNQLEQPVADLEGNNTTSTQSGESNNVINIENQ